MSDWIETYYVDESCQSRSTGSPSQLVAPALKCLNHTEAVTRAAPDARRPDSDRCPAREHRQ